MNFPVHLVVFAFLVPLFTTSPLFANDSDIGALFAKRGVEGTMILSSLDGSIEYVYNRQRSEKRYLPASTFKILHSLIALDEKVLAHEYETIEWDGKDKGWSRWNNDQSLSTALPDSCVWFYQEITHHLTNSRYLSHLQKSQYGNAKTGPDLSTFWLDGELAISAREQIEFLKKLYTHELPYLDDHISLVQKLLLVDSQAGHTVRAKTGWAMRIEDQHGWYVGYVEKEDEVWFFALNIDINSKDDGRYRKEIAYEALRLKDIL